MKNKCIRGRNGENECLDGCDGCVRRFEHNMMRQCVEVDVATTTRVEYIFFSSVFFLSSPT